MRGSIYTELFLENFRKRLSYKRADLSWGWPHQKSCHASTMVMMMTIFKARIYPCSNSMLIALEWPQSSGWLFLSLMVHAGYVCVAIIHRTLTWTTRIFIVHTGVNACNCTQGYKDTVRESALKVDSGRKSLAALGNRICVSSVTVHCSNQLSYIQSPMVGACSSKSPTPIPPCMWTSHSSWWSKWRATCHTWERERV